MSQHKIWFTSCESHRWEWRCLTSSVYLLGILDFLYVYLLLGCIRRWLAMSRLLRVRTRLRNRCTYFWLIFWNKKCDTMRYEYSWYFVLFICFWDAFGGGWRCLVSFAFGPVFGIAAHTSDSYSETRNVTQWDMNIHGILCCFICFWDAFGGGWRCLVSFAFGPVFGIAAHTSDSYSETRNVTQWDMNIHGILCCLSASGMHLEVVGDVSSPSRSGPVFGIAAHTSDSYSETRNVTQWDMNIHGILCCLSASGMHSEVVGDVSSPSRSTRLRNRCTYFWLIFWNKKCDTMRHEYSWYFVLFICFWDAFGGGWRCLVSFAFGPVFGIAAHTSDSYSETRNVTQ